jgi:hypothetical protein
MVSENSVRPDVPPNPAALQRGFVVEESYISGPKYVRMGSGYGPFWRPVFAGTLFVLSIFVFSWYLMLGFHVGVDRDNTIVPGAGAAVWMWVTSCIAFLFGGMFASAISGPRGPGWARGIGVWSLSVPLAVILYSFAARAGDLLGGLTLPRASVIGYATGSAAGMTANYAYLWSVVIALACGFVFAVIGAIAANAAMKTPDSAIAAAS